MTSKLTDALYVVIAVRSSRSFRSMALLDFPILFQHFTLAVSMIVSRIPPNSTYLPNGLAKKKIEDIITGFNFCRFFQSVDFCYFGLNSINCQ